MLKQKVRIAMTIRRNVITLKLCIPQKASPARDAGWTPALR
jgi:hypothetical protein